MVINLLGGLIILALGLCSRAEDGVPTVHPKPTPPPRCCPNDSLLDHRNRACFGGVPPALDCGGNTKFLLDPTDDEDDPRPLQITQSGSLRMGAVEVPSGQFCLAYLPEARYRSPTNANASASGSDSGEPIQVAIACHVLEAEPHVHIRDIVLLLLSLTSLVALAAVFVAHLIFSELRDLQGRCHMASVMGLLVGLASLVVVQNLTDDISEFMCQFLAFFVYFWLLSAFFWLNVTAFNVWRSVIMFHERFNETHLFMAFCTYAWGVPLCLLLLVAAMQFLPEGYAVLRPHFGLNTCWFHDSITVWSYFYGPVAILLLVNCIFFVWTTAALWTDYSTATLPARRRLKRRCLLSVKMYLVMGIGWIFELISSLDDDDSFMWFVMDAINMLQGVAIFLVLIVFRRRFWHAIHRRRPCGLDAPQWAIKRFLANENDGLGCNMEELKHLGSSDVTWQSGLL